MKLLSRYLHQVCAVYTVAVLFLLILNMLLGTPLHAATVNAELFLLLFVFVALFCAANFLLSHLPCAYGVRVLLHCALTVGGGYCILYLPTAASAASSGKLMMFLLILVVYWVSMAIYLGIRARMAKTREKNASVNPGKNR